MMEKGKVSRIDKLRIIQFIKCDLKILMKTSIMLLENNIVESYKSNLCQFTKKHATTMVSLVLKKYWKQENLPGKKISSLSVI